jgi:hypothetical protein
MSKAKIASAILWSAAMTTPIARGTTTASLVPVPISAGALADDPNLANYQTYDLQVGLPAGDKWVGADIRAVLTSGKFYIPPANDSNIIQPSLTNNMGTRYLQFDTMLMRPVFRDGVDIISGSFFSPDPNNPVFPSNGNNLKDPNDPNGTAFLPANDQMIVDAEFRDPQPGSATYATPGTYTIARLTVSNAATGQLDARVFDSQTPTNPVTFHFVIPEPSGLITCMTLLGCFVAIRRHRSSKLVARRSPLREE